ncbi:MAG: hypothetical protein AAF487_12165 [Bacteroidota bacterium]
MFFSQTPTSFSSDHQEFSQQLSDWMIQSDKKIGKEFMEQEFAPFWAGSFLNASQKDQVIEIGNVMLKKRMRAFPEFKMLCDFLLNYEESNLGADNFEQWYLSMIELGGGKRKSIFNDYLKTSESLISEKVLYRSNTVVWKTKEYGFSFQLDSLPLIKFEDSDLICLSKGDSSSIYKTDAVFLPTKNLIYGKGGEVTWERVGLPREQTYAKINNYKLRVKSSQFRIDSVQFYNAFFDRPLMGVLTEKIIAGKDSANASYPYFESYEKRLQIKNLVENVDYDGGFAMKGNKLEGFGTAEEPARLLFFKDDKKFINCEALAFTIKPEQVSSVGAKVSIYIRNDSIYHPGINLKFDRGESLLTLIRLDEGISKSPFYNSYHAIDMYFEALYWNMNDPLIRIGNLFGSSQTKAAFESRDFYKQRRFDAMLGIDQIHPLTRIKNFTSRIDSKEFLLEEYVRYMKLPKEQVIKQLIILNNQGFVDFDLNEEYIIVKQKLFDYLDNRSGKRDYDVLLFNSDENRGQNAQLNLLNNDLLLKGVSRIVVSDSQNVKIFPVNKEVTLRKNRDFVFDGTIVAGNVEFYGSDHEFNYDEFKIKLIQVDSVQMRVKSFDPNATSRRRILVKNVIEDMEGELLIDHPRNKSGRRSDQAPEFPIINSIKDSYVYYDRQDLQGGVYKREDFFFKVNPFVLDSLDNFDPTNIGLEGTLVSGGIFPDLEKALTVQEDYSLGFETNTGTNGLIAYSGKATFTNDLSLNYSGLQGSGDLDYLSAHAESDEFTFKPEQVLGQTSQFVNEGDNGSNEVPDVKVSIAELDYRPNDNILSITSIDERLDFFNGQTFFEGRVDLTPEGMTGDGTMHVIKSELESELMKFEYMAMTADTADFRLISEGTESMAFKTENVNARIDLERRKGTFRSNGEASFVEFPENQYICYMDVFNWYMDKNDIEMEYDGGVSGDFVIDTELDLTVSNFFSTRKDQDSLNFMAPKAIYNLSDKVIRCSEVDYVKIADARISPDSGIMRVRTRARIDPLQNASILANSVTKYHRIEEAEVSIIGANEYEASGLYNYLDENKKPHLIRLNEIIVDSALQTVAEGRVTEGDDFALSPAFAFYGDVFLEANQKNLIFDGKTRIFHECEGLAKNWMSFKDTIDPEQVYIPVSNAISSIDESEVGAGLMLGSDPFELYSTFLSEFRDTRDTRVLPADGYLYFNKKKQAYQIASKKKLQNPNGPGNFINLDINSCSVSGDGRFDFGANLGLVDFIPIGEYNHDIKTNTYIFRTALALDFYFSEEATKRMSEKILSHPDTKPIKITETKYEKAIVDLLGQEKSDKVIAELSLTGNLKKIPEDLQKRLFFSNVTFKWEDDSESYISQGKLGLVSTGKKQIFLEMNGKIQLIRKRGGDVLNIYLELDDANWFFFTYSKGLMLAVSSDKNFNTIITETKDDKRKAEKVKGKDPFSFMLGSRSKRSRFLDEMEGL